MVSFVFLDSILDELVGACLLDVIVEPGEVKLIHAETHQVQEWLDVVDWRRVRMYLVLPKGRKHGVSLEVLDLSVCPLLVGLEDVLCECEVNQIIVAIGDANVVQFQVPVAVPHLVKFVQGHQYLLSHLNDFDFEFRWLTCGSALHIVEPRLVQVDAAVAHQQLGALLLGSEREP